jgi:hypothetical protein
VDALPREQFPPYYDDDVWRNWRRYHLNHIDQLLRTVSEIPSRQLQERTELAITYEPSRPGRLAAYFHRQVEVRRKLMAKKNATPTKSQPELSDADAKWCEAFARALEEQGLDLSPENFDAAMKVAAAYGLIFDTGERSPEGDILWAKWPWT